MNRQQLFETIYEPVVIDGYKWQYVGDGWLDVKTGLVWLEEEKKKYTHNEAMSLFSTKDNRLPTIEEYKKAEEHGIRNVMKFKEYYWTSSVHPDDSNFACVFVGVYGSVGYYVGYVFRDDNYSVRCVRDYYE